MDEEVVCGNEAKRIFTINTNAGHAKAEESALKIFRLLTELR